MYLCIYLLRCTYAFIHLASLTHNSVMIKDLQKAVENAIVKIKVLTFKITYDVVCLCCFISSS